MVDKKVTSFKIERHHSHSWSYEYTIDGKHRDIIADSLPELKKIVLARGFPWKYEVDLNDWLKSDYAEESVSRRAAVSRITDESILVDLVKNASDRFVRIIAINNITDDYFLADVVKNDSDIFVRLEAARKINDMSFLVDVAKRYWKNRYASMAAVKKIDDESLLADVAKNGDRYDVCMEAVGKISDEYLLVDVIENASYEDVRLEAVKKISEESLLEDVVKSAFDSDVLIMSIDDITDETVLVDLAKIDPNLRLVRRKPFSMIEYVKNKKGRVLEEELEAAWEEYEEIERIKWEKELDQLMINQWEIEDEDPWQKTKDSDDHVLDTRLYSKYDYSYGDVNYEDDPD